MRFIPITKEERDFMNSTGCIPYSVLKATDGCTLGLYTPEQREEIEKQRERARSRQRDLLVQNAIDQSKYYQLSYLKDLEECHSKNKPK